MRSGVKWFLILVPIYVAGVLSGLYGAGKSSVELPETDQISGEHSRMIKRLEKMESERSRLQSELGRIAQVDLADYLRLRQEEEQYNKAKEILGKVFLVLFQNLLQDMPQDQVEFARSAAGDGASMETTGKPAVGAESPTVAATPVAGRSEPEQSPKSTTPAPASSWVQAEKDLAQLSPDRAEDFLKATVIKDIASEAQGYRPFKPNDSRISSLQGTYSGELVFLDPQKKPWNIEMTLNTEMKDGIPSGTFLVQITKDKGGTSQNSSNGQVRSIIQPVSASKAILMRLHESEYLQIYVLENQEIILGNYYHETQVGKLEHLGRFRLQR